MKHVGAYGMGTRALALLMALLMMLSTGGFALRDGTEPQPEPMAEVPADTVSEQVPAPSEDAPAPSEDIPAPSEDVPAPSEDVPAPSEDAPAPSEDAPAPSEDTPVPSEDTPAPSDDPANGENAPVGGVEPAPAETDPAEPSVEPSATPEPTADPNADVMPIDEPMPAAEAAPKGTETKLHFRFAYTGGTLTLTIAAVDKNVVGKAKNNGLKLTWSGSGTSQLKWPEIKEDLACSNANSSDAYVIAPGKGTKDTLEAGQSVTLTVPSVSTGTYPLTLSCNTNFVKETNYTQIVNVTINSDGTVSVAASDGSATFTNGEFTVDFSKTNGFADGTTGGGTTPGGGTNGGIGGDDSELTGTYNIIYHLNSPKGGEDKPVVVSSDDSNIFTVENLQKGVNFSDAGIDASYMIEDGSKGKYYFAGWDKDQIGKDNFPGYNNIDYPITYIPTRSGSDQGNRLILGGPTVQAEKEVTEGGTTQKFKTDLYAVWAPAEKAGMFGYSMSIAGSILGDPLVNGKKVVGDQVLADNGEAGDVGSGIQKYTVLDKGWKTEETGFHVNSVRPTHPNYIFVAWFNKNPGKNSDNTDATGTKGAFLLRPGAALTYKGNANVYSVDALWGSITPAQNVEKVYDGNQYAVTFDNSKGVNNPAVVLTGSAAGYTGVAKDALDNITDLDNTSFVYNVTGNATATDVDTLPTYAAPGIYNYTVKGKLTVPGDLYAESNAAETLDITQTTATLTIYPVLDLTVKKVVDGVGAPNDDFTFAVAATGDNAGNVQFSSGRSTSLTVKANESKTTQLYFTAPGAYTITVSETDDGVPGMTYAGDQTVTVNVDNNYHITNVSDGSTTTEYNGKAELTFTNTYGTGDLTVSKTVDGSTADQTKEFTFTVTLDAPISGTYGGVQFANGTASFTLKHNESKSITGLPAGVTYTVTEAAADGFTATSTGETGKIEAGKTAEAKFTNTRDVRLIYHLNVKDLTDATFPDTAPEVEGSSYTYTLKELNEAFPTQPTGASSYNAKGGSIKVGETTYYFAGWAKKSTATAYGGVDYPAWSPKSDTCELMGTPTLTTAESKVDLYAIWSTNPALLGYTMTIATGNFADSTQTGSQKLGDNGTASSGAKKYVVLDGGHNYENDKDTAITVTAEVPKDSSNAYTFLGWYNKQYDKEYKKDSYNGANPNNKGKPFTFPGGVVYFGNTNTVFSLDAVWGRVTMGDNEVDYDGNGHAVQTPVFEFQGGDLLKGDLAKYAKVTYTVEAQRRGGGDSQTTQSKDPISSYDEIELPKFTNPGVYDYTLKVTYASKDGGHGGEPQTLTATATLTIYPQLTLTVEKVLQNGNINVIGDYSFTVTSTSGATIEKPTLKVNVHAAGQDQASTKLWFPDPGTYTMTVTENKLAETVAPGVTFAEPQSFEVTVGSDYKISAITPSANGTIDAIGNAAAALTFVNTYSGGDLVVTKRIENSGASVGTQQKFHFKVDLHNTNITTKLNGNGEMVFTNGVAEFDLANGESMRATALPAGLNYTITETPVTGYETTYAVNSGTSQTGTECKGTMAAGGATVVFTNTYTQVGKLTVTKTVTGTGAPAGDSFQFLLTLTGASGKPLADRQVGSVHLDEHGQHGFNLKAGETMTFTGLPTGTKYTVQEQNVPVGYTVTPANASGEIGHHNAVSEATFTNTYQTGDLKITKTVAVGGNTQHPFNITIAAVALVGRTFTMEKSDGTTEQVTFAAPGGTAMVTLKHDESVTIKDLPAGAAYTVSEPGADPLGYDVTYSGGYTGTGSGTIAAGENTVTVTNTYRGGSLTITKNVTGTGAPEGAEFTFTVTLSDKTVNGPRGTYTHKGDASTPINFTSGVATLTLSHGESATIPGLPAGASYTVTEADVGAQGYTTTSTGSTGTIQKGGTVTAAFTNDYHPGRLIVTKTVTGSGADPNKTYHFKVELENKTSCNDKHGEMQFTNGVATFDLKDGGTISADGLYTNTKIKITETTDPDYETSVGGKVLADGVYECTIPVGGTHAVTAAFINRYKTGDLTVSKTVAGVGADVHRAFGFTVTLSDKSITGAYGGMTFANGTATFTLTSGSSLTATGLPAGTQYTVTETEADRHGYKTTSTGATGAIEDQKTATAAFTNTYESGSLAVTKTVTGQGSQQRDFHILVTLGDKTVNGQYGGMNFTRGVASFTLRHGQSATATGLPAGVTYEVAERWATDYTPTYTNGTGTIMKGQTAQVTVTNAYPGGSLKIAKTVIGEGAPEGAEFHFTVTLSDSGVNGPRGSYTHKNASTPIEFNDGVASLTLSSGESATIQGLRAGTTYTVTETDADQNDYETTSTGATGAIAEGQTAAAEFTNRYCPGSLTITKTVDGGDTSRRFTFTVTLSDKTFTGARGGVTFTNGVSTKIYLANGESATLNRLPLGDYTVTEAEANRDGYETTVNGTAGVKASGELTAAQTHGTAAFTNRFKRGSLTVSKTVAVGEKDKDFTFTVTLSKPMTGTFGGVEFKDGTATFTLHDGQSVTAADLPDGIGYEVTESPAPGFTTTATGAKGTISDGKTAVARFTNTRSVFPKLTLTVEKQLKNWNNNVIGDYSFTVTSDPETVTITKPDLKVNVYSAAKLDSADLTFPAPGTYTVTVSENKMDETVAPGVEFAPDQSFTVTVGEDYKITTITPAETGTVDASTGNAAVKLTFVNDYNGGDLVVRKTIENNGAGTRQSFHFKVDLHNTNINTKLNGNGEMVFTNGVAEFDLTNGGSMKATALPAGLSYTVTETDAGADGYAAAYTVDGTSATGTEYTGNIHNGENTVAFTNTYTKVGRLTVTKTVTGTGAPAGDSFQFLLTLTDANGAPLTGSYGGVAFDDQGTTPFTLKASESKTFTGLPSGTHYEVKETDVPVGYTVTSTGDSGDIPENNQAAKADFTNDYRTGDLTITKTVDGGGNQYHQFAFTVYFEQPVNGEFQTRLEGATSATGTLKFTNGESDKFYLQAAAGALPGSTGTPAPTSITILGLPAGISYWLVEDHYTEYKPSFGGDCELASGYTRVGIGTIDAGPNLATVNNHYTGGNLDVTKKVTVDPASGRLVDPTETFNITVTLDTTVKVDGPRGYIGEDTNKFVTFKDNVATFELHPDETAHLQGLPNGARYTVTEDEDAASARNYVVRYGNGTGVINDDAEGVVSNKATVENSYQPGTLRISKTVAGVGADKTKEYSFTITQVGHSECNHGAEVHGVAFTNGVAHVTLKDGEHVDLKGLYANSQVTIQETEANQNGYETTVNGQPVGADGSYTVEIGNDRDTFNANVNFVNTYKTGSLTVSKTVVDRPAGRLTDFHFTVTAKDASGAPIQGAFGDMTFDANGQYTFALPDGGSESAENLPDGTIFTVTETEADQHGYRTTVNGAAYPAGGFTGAIQYKDPATAAFTNTYESGSLAVAKTVTGGGNLYHDFSILVTLDDETVNGQYGEMKFAAGVASFTLRHGQTVTAEKLPAGVTYTVTEIRADDYKTTYTNQTGTITKGQTAQVTVTNAYPGGGLKITKTVIGEGAPAGDEFHFTVTLSDSGVNGPRGTYAHDGNAATPINFTHGVAELTMRGGESADIQGLRAGTTYTVTETDADRNGYETTFTGATGTIAEGQTAAADFTNRYCPGSLTVTKTVDGGDTSRQFTFTVTLSDNTFTGDRSGIAFEGGQATFLLTNGGHVTFDRLPLGGYTVTEAEADQDGYATTATGASGTLSATQPDGTAAFTNRFKRGGLTVTKTVVGTEADKQKDFTFTVTLSDTTVTGVYGDMSFTGGVAAFALHDGQSVTATDLPDGIGYEVTEEDTDPNFTVTATGAEGTVSDGTTAEARFTNTHKTGSLSVSKEVTLAARGDEDRAFQFTVTLSDNTVNGTYGVSSTAMTFENGVATFGLKNDDSKTATDLPAGVTATVTEADAEGYATTVNGEPYDPAAGVTVTVPQSGSAELRFVNRYTQSGNLSLTKQVAGDGADPDREFSFTIQTDDWTLNGGYGGMTFARGSANVTLRAGKTVTATGLPAGTTYTIYEDTATGYTATVNGQSYDPMSGVTGTIPGDNATAEVTFTNTYQTGDLTIAKTVNGSGNQYAKFHFTLTLSDDYIGGEFQTSNGPLSFLDGVAGFDLSAGQSITIHGLPAGVGYTLEEDPADDYEPTITNGVGVIAAGVNNQVDVVNHYTGGNLKITKQVAGTGADMNAAFDFTLRLPNHPINGPRGGVTFENGVATFTLKGGQSVEVLGLPNGAEYVVEEDAAKAGDMGYLVGYPANAHGYIQDNEAGQYTAEVVVTNTYAPGDLVIAKRVTGAGADPDKEYHFTVTIEGGCSHGNIHGLTFENGVATFTLKDGQSQEIKHLREDAALTITEGEANADGYVTTVNGQPYNGGYIVDLSQDVDHAATAVFENHRANGNLTVTKAVVDAPAGRRPVFNFTVTLSDETINGTFGNGQTGMTFTNGIASFALADGQSRTATGLPANVTYTVTETNVTGYTAASTGAAGVIEDGKTATAAFTNTYHYGDLTVTDAVTGQGNIYHSFPITVTLNDDAINGTYGGMRFTNGTATFALTGAPGSNTMTTKSLPAGVRYTVTELTENQDGYTTTYDKNRTGPIIENVPARTDIINYYPGGGLTVSKTVTGAGADPDAEFHFTVTVYKDGSVDTDVTGPRGAYFDGALVNFSNGTASLVLKNGQSAAIKGLPAGDTYTVREREANQGGYVTTVTGGTDPAAPVVAAGTITDNGNAEAAFTNAYQPGSLTVTKTVEGTDADKQKEFTFTVTLADKTFAGATGGVTFTDGQASFTLTDGQSVTLEGLPLGGYTVAEEPVTGYETTVNGQKAQSISGELTDQGRVEVSFINRYIASDLTVTNTVQGEGADLTKPFTFTVTLSDDTVTGQYGGMTFIAGVAAFTLKHGESLTATGLPAVPATVVESDRDGYTTSVTSAQLSRAAAAPEDQATIDVTLAEGARTQVDFVNEIKPVPAEPTEPAEPTPTESTPAEPTPAEPTPTEPTPTEPTPTATEPAEPTPVATATPTPVTATAVPTAPNTSDEARPVLWAALLALSALGLGAVLTLRRKKHD